MSHDGSLLNDAAEALEFTRAGTLAEAENIPDERWDFRPHPGARSVAELVRHILQATAMLVGEATDPEGDFQRRTHEEHVRAHLGPLPETMSPEELRERLGRSQDDLLLRVREAGEDLMMQGIRRFDGGSWKRLTYLFYASSHEEYHRGQLATYARIMGLVPALTRRIHGDGAK